MLPGMQQRGCSGEPCGIQLCNDSDQRQTSGGLRFKKVLNQLLLCCLSLKDWKAGRSLFAKVQPKYNPTPEETVGTAKIPTLKICNMATCPFRRRCDRNGSMIPSGVSHLIHMLFFVYAVFLVLISLDAFGFQF